MAGYSGWTPSSALDDFIQVQADLANQQQTATAAQISSLAQQAAAQHQKVTQLTATQIQEQREALYRAMEGSFEDYYKKNQEELDRIKEEDEKKERVKNAKLLERFL